MKGREWGSGGNVRKADDGIGNSINGGDWGQHTSGQRGRPATGLPLDSGPRLCDSQRVRREDENSGVTDDPCRQEGSLMGQVVVEKPKTFSGDGS